MRYQVPTEKDCKGMPQQMSSCVGCRRLADPIRASDEPRKAYIDPDLRYEERRWTCASRDVRPHE